MTITLDHRALTVCDNVRAARYRSEGLGLPPRTLRGRLAVARIGEASPELVDTRGQSSPRQLAAVASEREPSESVKRVREFGQADPSREASSEISRWGDGRGAHFEDPIGKRLDRIARSSGSSCTEATSSTPVLAGGGA